MLDESLDAQSNSNSTNTRSKKQLNEQDFTPLKEKLDDSFFDD